MSGGDSGIFVEMNNEMNKIPRIEMRSEEEIREMIDRIDRKIEENPVSDKSAPNELHRAKLTLKWVLLLMREKDKEAEKDE